MIKNVFSKQYEAAFDFLQKRKASKLKEHIRQLKKLEEFMPKGLTFMFVTNASTQKYLFFTDNVENCTGFSKDELYAGGVPFVMGRVHEEDKELWSKAVSLLTDKLFQLNPKDILKCNLQFNYRFQHKNGDYINMIDNFIPLELNEDGKPYIFFGQVNIVGFGEKLPVNASMSILKPSGYKSLFSVNVNSAVLTELLTKRENVIFRLIQMGYSSLAISQECHISLQTVKTHRKNINVKLKKLMLTKDDLYLSSF